MIVRYLAIALLLAAGLNVPAHAENLSVRSVFDDKVAGDPPSAEAKIERMRAAVAERAHEKEVRAQNAEHWKSETDSTVASAGIRMIQGLAVCVGLLLIGLHVLKKYNRTAGSRSASGRRMRVIERMPLSAKTSLVMLEVEGRTVVVSVGPDHVSQLQQETAAVGTLDYSNPMDVLCRDDLKISAA